MIWKILNIDTTSIVDKSVGLSPVHGCRQQYRSPANCPVCAIVSGQNIRAYYTGCIKNAMESWWEVPNPTPHNHDTGGWIECLCINGHEFKCTMPNICEAGLCEMPAMPSCITWEWNGRPQIAYDSFETMQKFGQESLPLYLSPKQTYWMHPPPKGLYFADSILGTQRVR